MKPKYFGTDGIRGIANQFPITPEIALRTGVATAIAFGRYYRNAHATSVPHRVVIGKDTRLSCYMLENALVAGFTSAGWNVLLLGPIPTPAVSLLCRSMRADLGIMISASHNPYYYNGIKIFDKNGVKFSDEIENFIEDLLDNPKLFELSHTEKLGRVKRLEGDIYRYTEFAKHSLPKNLTLEGLRIVIDCANGAAYKVAPNTLWELGAEVIAINDKPNGCNINLNCGSTSLDSLIEQVKQTRADIGIALDGDADRVMMVDDKAQIIDGDKILAIIAKNWQKANLLRNNKIVATHMSNLGLENFLNKINLELVRTNVGDRYVAQRMQEISSNLGGEQSGHIIFSDFSATGDGLMTALQILACVRQENKKLSELHQDFISFPQILNNVKIKNPNILSDCKISKEIELAKEKLGKKAYLYIRKSGTEPLIRIMAQGENIKIIQEIVQELSALIHAQDI